MLSYSWQDRASYSVLQMKLNTGGSVDVDLIGNYSSIAELFFIYFSGTAAVMLAAIK